ncbi:MAG TPA: hypothetical protein VIW19_01700 [Gaiellaceae bacterium]|jgi:hypothetical protein
MSQPNKGTKDHLDKNHVDPSSLPDAVIDAMNDCSDKELKAMDKVGKALTDTNVDLGKALKAVH